MDRMLIVVGDPAKARDVIVASHEALMAAGAYRPYDTEIEAAKTWRAVVLPIANSDEFSVEVGTLITERQGRYFLSAPWSSGEHQRVTGLFDQAPKSPGAVTGAVHTHPRPGGWVGGDRAIAYFGSIDERGVGGYAGQGDVQAGDLATAYRLGINIYIADDEGLHGWNYEAFRDLQRVDEMKPIRLGDAYRQRL